VLPVSEENAVEEEPMETSELNINGSLYLTINYNFSYLLVDLDKY
jgi:hypothetical protein